MIQINVFKNKKHAFSIALNKKDARKFLNRFKGEKEYFEFNNVSKEFNFNMTCSEPKGYWLDVFDYTNDNALKRAIDLMDGDL